MVYAGGQSCRHTGGYAARLRHTCASLAVSAGVNVLALQRMLGHTSAKMTLDTCADLFDDDLDAVAVTLHARYSPESVPNCAHRRPTTGRSRMKTAIYQHKQLRRFCAGGGIRTHTLFRARAPKARAYTNFATPAFAPAIVPSGGSTNLSVTPRQLPRSTF